MQSKNKIKGACLLVLLLFFFSIFLVSLINIIKWKIDSDKTGKEITNLQNDTTIEEIVDNTKTNIIEQTEEIDSSNPYYDYIKYNLIDVDFTKLKAINEQTRGWIQVMGTNINYPFVQASDNQYYLNHSFDKTYNEAGWIFLDYRNDISNSDKNTILYAHSRLDKTMFGSLTKVITTEWLNDPSNYVIRLSTEYENTLWQIFSFYRIPTTTDYLQTTFVNDDDFLEFANKLLKRSSHDFNTTITKDDRIITLSTCYNNSDKFVLHAKLIKVEIK